MKAPKKIYMPNELLSEEWTRHIEGEDVEYTRTDAFIEKACDAYCAICDTKECGDTGECVWVEKFRRRLMK